MDSLLSPLWNDSSTELLVGLQSSTFSRYEHLFEWTFFSYNLKWAIVEFHNLLPLEYLVLVVFHNPLPLEYLA